MKYPHLAIGIALIALVSAACGGAAAPTPSPVSTATAAPSPTAALTAAPSAAATATPTATTAPTAALPTRPPGMMLRGRSVHTATRLDDGHVLVAGGYLNAVPIASADLYDPVSDTFAATGQMVTARGFDTATRLADGRVLFTGGNSHDWRFDGPFFASAELYDPTTGTFSQTGPMVERRNLHTATLLLDGRVLIAGGNDTYDTSLASAELYDPLTGTFSPTGSMTTARGFHTATLLQDGGVLIAGGGPLGWTDGAFVASAEVFDPATGTFSATGSMTTERALPTTTLLNDGRVLITGGWDNYNGGSTSLASAELYDPDKGKFTATGSMADARAFDEATLLADGRVLLTGGLHTGWDWLAPFLETAETFDPTTGEFSATGLMTDGRVDHSATLLANDRVLIAGGFNGSADVATAELYDPVSGTFSPTGSGT